MATAGTGTTDLHLGHFGSFFIINTYDKHPGHPTATGDEKNLSSFSSSAVSLTEDDDDEYELGDDNDDIHNDEDRFFATGTGSFSARSKADFTLSRVQTLW